MAKLSKLRVVACGHVLDVYRYGKGVWHDYEGNGGRRASEDCTGEWSQKSRQQTRQRVRQQVNANFGNVANAKFVTLTFRDGAVQDVTDVQECNKAFKRFTQRMRRRFGGFKYIAVIEFQDGNGRGAVHYHMICDLPYIKADELAELWGNGFVKINRITHVDNVGAYVTKYMLKDCKDPRLKGQKAYLGARNLDKPTVMMGDDAEAVLEAYKLGGEVKPTYTGTFTSYYVGVVSYAEFNLLRPSGQRPRVVECTI